MKHFKFINYPQDCLKSLKTVHFGSGSWVLDPAAKAVIRQNAACLRDNPGIGIILQGHCDIEESNGPDPNIGRKRAEAVRDYLVQLGVQKKRLAVEDRGATTPVDPGLNEAAFAKNRRVEFIPKFEINDCNGEDSCGWKDNGDDRNKCDSETDPDCSGKETPGCFFNDDCNGDDSRNCGKKEADCTPDEVCDDCDDDCDDNCNDCDNDGECDYCENDDGCPDCEEDMCGANEICKDCADDEGCPDNGDPSCGESGPPEPSPDCEFCDGEGPPLPPDCGVMEIISFPDCGREGQSA